MLDAKRKQAVLRQLEEECDRVVSARMSKQGTAVIRAFVEEANKVHDGGYQQRASGTRKVLSGIDIARILNVIKRGFIGDAIKSLIARAYKMGSATVTDSLVDMGVERRLLLDFQASRLPKLVDRYIEARFNSGRPQKIDDTTRAIVNQAVLDAIEQGMSIGEAARYIRTKLNLSLKRSKTVARTEMAIAMNGSRYETYVRNGVVKHMWSATQDERTRDSHFYLNGEVRNVGEEFAKNLRFPGDPNAPAEEVINCRCTTVPAGMPPLSTRCWTTTPNPAVPPGTAHNNCWTSCKRSA
jgi:SPP1 gp7 family putative phage head morphogenesis protein